MSATDLCPSCGGDCGVGECETLATADAPGSLAFEDWDDEPCSHDCDEYCDDYGCSHAHCMNCGGCGCPGYCDDTATYNVRPPSETGGPADA